MRDLIHSIASAVTISAFIATFITWAGYLS